LFQAPSDDGAAIPERFTCDGENLSTPHFLCKWSGAPAGTLEFCPALATIPMRPPAHGIIGRAYDIPSAVTELAVDAAQNAN